MNNTTTEPQEEPEQIYVQDWGHHAVPVQDYRELFRAYKLALARAERAEKSYEGMLENFTDMQQKWFSSARNVDQLLGVLKHVQEIILSEAKYRPENGWLDPRDYGGIETARFMSVEEANEYLKRFPKGDSEAKQTKWPDVDDDDIYQWA